MKCRSNANEALSPAVIKVASCGAREKATTGGEEIRPGQWLCPRIVLERGHIFQGLRSIARRQQRLNGVTIEPQVVMPDRTSVKHFLAFSQQCGPLSRIVHGAAQGARDLWPAELRSCFSSAAPASSARSRCCACSVRSWSANHFAARKCSSRRRDRSRDEQARSWISA